MENTYITKLIDIGNSKGVLIPKRFRGSLGEIVSIKQVKNGILIERYNETVAPQDEWEKILATTDYDYTEFADLDVTSNDGLND